MTPPSKLAHGNRGAVWDFLNGNPPPHSVSKPTQVEDADARTVLTNFWATRACTFMNHTTLSRQLFVRLWTARAVYLSEIRQFHASADRSDSKLSSPLLRALKTVPGMYERIGFFLLAEVVRLCDSRSKLELGHKWSIRSTDKGRFAILSVSPQEQSAATGTTIVQPAINEARTIKLDWDSFISATDLSSQESFLGDLVLRPVLGDPCFSLSSSIAPAFTQADPVEFERMLHRIGYVLSADTSVKLLLLNERRRVGLNVILSGDTGGCAVHCIFWNREMQPDSGFMFSALLSITVHRSL